LSCLIKIVEIPDRYTNFEQYSNLIEKKYMKAKNKSVL